jgi:outer membrane protein OmpA-like peptidoglycan-associated protein
MERKVLSFDQFIFESVEPINEAFTVKSLQLKVEGGELINKGLALVGDIFSKSKNGDADFESELEEAKETLDLWDKSSSISNWTPSMTVNEIELPSVINGNIQLIKEELGGYSYGKEYPKPTMDGDWSDGEQCNLLDVLAQLNADNLYKFDAKDPGSILLDGKPYKKKGDAGNVFRYSGAAQCNFLIRKRGGITLEKYHDGDATLPNGVKTEGLEDVEQVKYDKKESKIPYSIVLYGIKSIEIGEGSPMEGTALVREEILIGGEETVELDIKNKDKVLFEQNKSELKQGGKDVISQALGIFTKISSIKVTGGASQEGSEERNKELCKLRAESVKKYLGELTKAPIEANPEGLIQPEDGSKEERSKWRRVILEVKGEKVSPTIETKVVYNSSSEELKADKYTIAQMVLTFDVEFKS